MRTNGRDYPGDYSDADRDFKGDSFEKVAGFRSSKFEVRKQLQPSFIELLLSFVLFVYTGNSKKYKREDGVVDNKKRKDNENFLHPNHEIIHHTR